MELAQAHRTAGAVVFPALAAIGCSEGAPGSRAHPVKAPPTIAPPDVEVTGGIPPIPKVSVSAASHSSANVEVTDRAGTARFLGDYEDIDVTRRDVMVVWTDRLNDAGDIYFARAPEAAVAGGPLVDP